MERESSATAGTAAAVAPLGDAAAYRTFGPYTNARDNNCDFVRFLLATVVLFAHAFLALYRGPGGYDVLHSVTYGQAALGHLAVQGFFAISGALIAASWERSATLLDFLRNRVLRIYPGFIACYVLCLFLVAPLSGLSWQQYREQLNLPLFAVKMLLLRGFGGFQSFPDNPQHMLNGSLWTIPYEFGCYLLIAAFAVFGRLRPRAILIGAGLAFVWNFLGVTAASVSATLPPHYQGAFVAVAQLPGVAEACPFMVGAAFHVLKDRVPFSGKLAWLAALLIVVAARVPPCLALVLPWAFPYQVFFAVYHPGLQLRSFGKRADLSYGIYLWGWPVEQMLVRFFEPHLNGVGLFLLSMPVVCLLALASWTWVEKPFLQLKKRRAPKQTSAFAS